MSKYFFWFFLSLTIIFSHKMLLANSEKDVAVRIKDLVEIRGVRPNQLTGLGLVVGLAGTGDSRVNLATNKAASFVLSRLGLTVNPNEVATKNMAVVAVTAELPPFARIGDRVPIRISSIGDSSSLEGGTLMFTTLTAADGFVYATAQGSVSQGTSMVGAQGGGSSRVNANEGPPKTVALSNAAVVEREFETTFVKNNVVELSLRSEDFTTASRISVVINQYFGEFIADPVNAGLVKIHLPSSVTLENGSFNPVTFISAVEQLRVMPDEKATIVINERTGTVISGSQVIISPVTITHGNLEIQIGKKQKTQKVSKLEQTTTVDELVNALNVLGAGPKDVVSILQTLESARALKAQLKLM